MAKRKFTYKRPLLTTSAVILLTLFNVSEVYAEADEEDVENTEAVEEQVIEDEDNEEDTEEVISEADEEKLDELKTELEENYSEETLKELFEEDDELTELFETTLINHENEVFDLVTDNYKEIIENFDFSDEAEELILDLRDAASEDIKVSDFLDIKEEAEEEDETSETEDETKDEDESEDEEKTDSEEEEDEEETKSEDSSSDTEEEAEEDSEEDSDSEEVEEEKESSQESIEKQAIEAQADLDADEMYENVIDAETASDAWLAAQDFKNTYPDDDRVTEAMDSASDRIYRLGKYNHKHENYELAIHYYDLLLAEDSISDSLRAQLNIYYEQATKEQKTMSADEMYDAVINASNASNAWQAAEDYKIIYPDDSNLQDAINQAADRMFKMGRYNHRNENYSTALHYYDLLLAEDSLIESDLRNKVEAYYAQATDNQAFATESDMYDEVIDASNASSAWEKAQEFKKYFPESKKLQEVFESAGRRIYNMGVTSQKSKNFAKAIVYYDLLLDEENIDAQIIEQVSFYKEQAENESTAILEDDLLNEVLDASNASNAWESALKFKEIYPDSSKLEEAFNSAGRRIYNMGVTSHKNSNFEKAIHYYELLLEESMVAQSMRSEAELYLSLAKENEEIVTVKEAVKLVREAENASAAWSNAMKYQEIFADDSEFVDALNDAARRMFSMGLTNHKNGNFDKALVYYNEILSESLVSNKYAEPASELAKLAEDKKDYLTPNDYYQAVSEASNASAAWEKAVEGSLIYPNDSKVLDALNEAANRNLKLGRSYQRKGNTSQAKIYYDRVLDEPNVSESIHTLAKVFSNQLSGSHQKVVYVDPGHGGSDSGANFGGVSEKTLTLNTARYLKEELEARGYLVIMSREADNSVELSDRPNEANKELADIFVSVHYNSMGGAGTGRGIETFIHHTVESGYGQEVDHSKFLTDDPRISESLGLAKSIHKDLISGTSMLDRGVKGNNFNVLRNTHIPAILTELGFIDNATEREKIRQASYQKNAAKSIANGVDKYFEGL